ncbi:MAG TPA: hypothetical protein ENF90_00925 [Candidatus Bathyarchaeota archaeon]|nr:hypothetical protein [Candidatus Bathyarchaeota archaeon]
MRKTLIKVALIYLALLLVGTAIAAYWIYSSVIQVTVSDYTLTLSATTDGRLITLNATLKDPNGDPVNGTIIYFYNCTDINGSGRTQIGTNVTDLNGVAIFKWLAPKN